MEGVPKQKLRAVNLPRRPLADTFLHGALVHANAYQHTEFKLPISISFGDMEGSQSKKKMGFADLPRRPLADRVLVLTNAYQCAKFQLPSFSSFRDKEEVPKLNVGLLAP